LNSKSIFASIKSPSLAADTNLSPEAEHPKEFPIPVMKSSKKTNSRFKKINGVFIIYRKMKTLVLDLMEKLCDGDVAAETKTHTVTVFF
jgi:hypothetical protein